MPLDWPGCPHFLLTPKPCWPWIACISRCRKSPSDRQVPGVLAVITGKDLDAAGLAWMPTLSADTEAVLALDRVHFQMQEVAFRSAGSGRAGGDHWQRPGCRWIGLDAHTFC